MSVEKIEVGSMAKVLTGCWAGREARVAEINGDRARVWIDGRSDREEWYALAELANARVEV